MSLAISRNMMEHEKLPLVRGSLSLKNWKSFEWCLNGRRVEGKEEAGWPWLVICIPKIETLSLSVPWTPRIRERLSLGELAAGRLLNPTSINTIQYVSDV